MPSSVKLPIQSVPVLEPGGSGRMSFEWYRALSELVRAVNNGTGGAGITTEQAVDAVAAALAAGSHTNITVTYNDPANSISLAAAAGYTDEMAQDAVAAALAAGTHSNITVSYNDASNSISLSGSAAYTDEQAQDAVAAAIAAGTHSGISISYNDAANSISFTNTGGGGGGSGTTELLLLLNGSNGSTTFTDSSASPKTVTAVSGSSLSTAQARFGSASMIVNGSGARASITNAAGLNLQTGDFTIQLSVRFVGLGTTVIFNSGSATGFFPWQIAIDSSSKPWFRCFDSGGTLIVNIVAASACTTGVWYDLALSRSGNTFTGWVNGSSVGTATSSAALYSTTANLTLGAYDNAVAPMNGYIDHVRIKKGEAVAISALTTEFTS